ncbi:MAG: ORF6N domain-containing protein [Woeseiaceae bacterium]
MAGAIVVAVYKSANSHQFAAHTFAALYGVTANRLNVQVKRNRERFPSHFVFRLRNNALSGNRSQIATGSHRYRNVRFPLTPISLARWRRSKNLIRRCLSRHSRAGSTAPCEVASDWLYSRGRVTVE